jgi:hypothetical protein
MKQHFCIYAVGYYFFQVPLENCLKNKRAKKFFPHAALIWTGKLCE